MRALGLLALLFACLSLISAHNYVTSPLSRWPGAAEGGAGQEPCDGNYHGPLFIKKAGDPIVLTWTNNHNDQNRYYIKMIRHVDGENTDDFSQNLLLERDFPYQSGGYTRETFTAPYEEGVYTFQFKWAAAGEQTCWQCIDFQVVRNDSTCYDGRKNGDEAGVDCGGSCNACSNLAFTSITGCTNQADGSTIKCGHAGGYPITITGSGFLQPVSVYIEGVAHTVTSVSDSQIVFNMGTGLGVSGPNPAVMVVSNNTARVITNKLWFAAPTITSISAGSACSGSALELNCGSTSASGLAVTITGQEFGPSAAPFSVLFNGIPAARVSRAGDNKVVATVSSDAAQTLLSGTSSNAATASLQVTVGAGNDYSVDNAVLNFGAGAVSAPTSDPVDPIVVNSLAGCPNAGCPTQGGIPLTIKGSGFGDAADYNVSITVNGGEPLEVLSHTNTKITFNCPAGFGGQQFVLVAFSSPSSPATTTTLSTSFNYAAPTITTLDSQMCNISDGASLDLCDTTGGLSDLTITGSNFGSGGATVYVAGLPLTTTHDATSPHTLLTASFANNAAIEKFVFLPGSSVTVAVAQQGGSSSVRSSGNSQAVMAFTPCLEDERLYANGSCIALPPPPICPMDDQLNYGYTPYNTAESDTSSGPSMSLPNGESGVAATEHQSDCCPCTNLTQSLAEGSTTNSASRAGGASFLLMAALMLAAALFA